MNDQFRLHLDIERVSEQLGIDCRKFLGAYQSQERQEHGNRQAPEGKEGDINPEEKTGLSD